MINYKTICIGDKVKVVGMGAPDFAKLGEELEIVALSPNGNGVTAQREDGLTADFYLSCGASRLELVGNTTPQAEAVTTQQEAK